MAIEVKAWPAPEELEANRLIAIAETRAEISALEAQHGMTSAELEAGLSSGAVLASPEMEDWLMTVHWLRMLERGNQA